MRVSNKIRSDRTREVPYSGAKNRVTFFAMQVLCAVQSEYPYPLLVAECRWIVESHLAEGAARREGRPDGVVLALDLPA